MRGKLAGRVRCRSFHKWSRYKRGL